MTDEEYGGWFGIHQPEKTFLVFAQEPGKAHDRFLLSQLSMNSENAWDRARKALPMRYRRVMVVIEGGAA